MKPKRPARPEFTNLTEELTHEFEHLFFNTYLLIMAQTDPKERPRFPRELEAAKKFFERWAERIPDYRVRLDLVHAVLLAEHDRGRANFLGVHEALRDALLEAWGFHMMRERYRLEQAEAREWAQDRQTILGLFRRWHLSAPVLPPPQEPPRLPDPAPSLSEEELRKAHMQPFFFSIPEGLSERTRRKPQARWLRRANRRLWAAGIRKKQSRIDLFMAYGLLPLPKKPPE